MNRGVCTHLPSACSKAAARTPLPCPDADARCPECGAALLPIEGAGAAATEGGASRLALPALAVAIALGVGWAWWPSGGREAGPAPAVAVVVPTVTTAGQAASAIEAQPPTAGLPATLTLRGMDVLGPALGSELLSAFLAREGHAGIQVAPPDPAASAVQVITGQRPGGARQELRLDVGGGALTASEAGLRRVAPGVAPQPGDVLVGFDALAVVVHPESALRQIDRAALTELLAGRIADGARLGAAPGPVRLHLRQAGSEVDAQVRALLPEGTAPAADVTRHVLDADLLKAVAADPAAVGLVPLSAAGAARVIPVADAAGTLWLPSAEAVATERYPLTHRLVMQSGPDQSPFVQRLADHLVTTEVQARLRARGVVSALPAWIEPAAVEPVAFGPGIKVPRDYQALTRGARQLGARIGFTAGSAELDAAARADVERLARRLRDVTARAGGAPVSLMVLGLASDPVGYCANRTLSQRRATAVGQALADLGVTAQVVHGVGRAVPASVSARPEATLDRRVEVWVAEGHVRAPSAFRCISGSGATASATPSTGPAGGESAP